MLIILILVLLEKSIFKTHKIILFKPNQLLIIEKKLFKNKNKKLFKILKKIFKYFKKEHYLRKTQNNLKITNKYHQIDLP